MSGFRPRFFVPSPRIDADAPPAAGSLLALNAEDSHHARHVLRLRPGDECEVVVGAAVYAATVLAALRGASDKTLRVRLKERLEGEAAGARYRFVVGLVQAVTRPPALGWSVEKSTEAGASLFLLLQTTGSPRSSGSDAAIRLVRWERVAREAAKQSKQPAVPSVELVPSLEVALARLRSLALFSILLDRGAEEDLYDLVTGRFGRPLSMGGAPAPPPADAGVALWVGPEGGWTEREREALLESGLVAARLGHAVLRTETAGPLGVAVARLALGDW